MKDVDAEMVLNVLEHNLKTNFLKGYFKANKEFDFDNYLYNISIDIEDLVKRINHK